MSASIQVEPLGQDDGRFDGAQQRARVNGRDRVAVQTFDQCLGLCAPLAGEAMAEAAVGDFVQQVGLAFAVTGKGDAHVVYLQTI